MRSFFCFSTIGQLEAYDDDVGDDGSLSINKITKERLFMMFTSILATTGKLFFTVKSIKLTKLNQIPIENVEI